MGDVDPEVRVTDEEIEFALTHTVRGGKTEKFGTSYLNAMIAPWRTGADKKSGRDSPPPELPTASAPPASLMPPIGSEKERILCENAAKALGADARVLSRHVAQAAGVPVQRALTHDVLVAVAASELLTRQQATEKFEAADAVAREARGVAEALREKIESSSVEGSEKTSGTKAREKKTR
jgi:hypothetical protein